MSQPFLKDLECLCIKGVSGTCPGGGGIGAFLNVEAVSSSNIISKSSITAPAKLLSCTGELESVVGSGPLYTVKFKDSASPNCSDISEGWKLTINSVEYEVRSVYSDGSMLIYGISNEIESFEGVSVTTTGYELVTKPEIIGVRGLNASVNKTSSISAVASAFLNLGLKNVLSAEGNIKEGMLADYSAREHLTFTGHLKNTFTDKVAGERGSFKCEQKLYPSGDLAIDAGFGSFVGPIKQTTNLHSFVDEGVYAGLLEDRGDAYILADDRVSFIHPDTVHTEGLFQYKCELTHMYVRPQESNLRMRISAPLENYESKIAPQYTVYNIKFSDPSGNLIVKYNDIVIRGDAGKDDVNYATYCSSPQQNVISEKYDWERRTQPHMFEGSGYSLSFSVRAVALDDAFDAGFNRGFEENYILPEIISNGKNNYLALDGEPLSAQERNFINPTAGFRISAIEICNSGGRGPRPENYIPVYAAVDNKGRRLERSIKPNFMHLYNYDTTIYPCVSSVWQSERYGLTNETTCGSQELVRVLRKENTLDYIQLTNAFGGGVADSGKLLLRFDHGHGDPSEITKGAFNIEFDQGTKNIWWKPSGSFNVENRNSTHKNDIPFFAIDTLTLKVMAKKESASNRDYVLDVVGYSDDKLLNVTSPSGGFIQNPSGVHLNDTFVPSVGVHPIFSGFYPNSDDFALDGTSISEREKYFESSGNFGGDHYSLTQYPFVTGTEFELYEIPLKIADDVIKIGKSRNYYLSSLLERVYLDIFPLPSGASIAHISLNVRYSPQNALNLSTEGGQHIGKIQDGRSEGALHPTNMGENDNILNAGSGYAPISRIEGIPHAYQTPSSIKSNYSRRWRGVEGTVRGPYDPDAFAFSFENPVIDYPFLSGYYKFDNFDAVDTRYVKSSPMGPATPSGLGTLSGLFNSTPEVYRNIGWRFSSGTLFSNQLPNYSGNYTTTDWTSLSKGSVTFVNNPMYGKIADAFDTVVRISGAAQNVNFGNIDTTSGFSIFTRFTPDANVSGQNHNLFESGVIFSKWDTPSEMDFALGYKGGFLCAYAKDDADSSIIEVKDTIPYSGYTYPINVLLTYNDNETSGLKLYVDSDNHIGAFESIDFDSDYNTPYILRASGGPFYKNSTSADLVLGFSSGSGVGMNMLVSEFGVSTWSSGVDTLYGTGTNIVESNADWTYKQVTAEKFFENIRATYFSPQNTHAVDRYKLWDRVNEDTFNDWTIGAFKHCQFGLGFDQLSKRPNKEQIVIDIKHHGSGYSSYADLVMPVNVDSGVSYHTQIENDFLRFHLSDVPDVFHSVNKRITKNLPLGYKFAERALVVESVIEHKSSGTIKWPTCSEEIGPRFIVSLYTKKQDPYWTANEPNWGLVNRKVHYLEPSSCLMRLDTTFTYDDICDTSEQWALFPEEPRLKDFTERYFSDDINDMFVQYDLVYPSGPYFESRIELHSAHVRMSNANINTRFKNDNAPLYVSGAYPSTESLNLVLGEIPRPVSGLLPLLIQVPQPFDNLATSGLPLNASGAFRGFATMPLYMPEFFANNLDTSGVLMYTSGEEPTPIGFNKLNLCLPNTFASLGQGGSNNSREEKFGNGFSSEEDAVAAGSSQGLSGSHVYKDRHYPGSPSDYPVRPGVGSDISPGVYGYGPDMPLFILNSDNPTASSIPLYAFGSSGNKGAGYTSVPLYIHNKQPSKGSISESISLVTVGISQLLSTIRSAKMPLVIKSPNILSGVLPLTLGFTEQDAIDSSGSLNLFTASYPVGAKGFGSAYGFWSNNDYGTGIEISDNYLTTVSVDNEIRGVDLTAYGSCTGDSPSKAIDPELATDDTVWRQSTCNDGGIFRAKSTYTNPTATSFDGVSVGYSGNYYGVRKFTKLLPSQTYQVEMIIKTGSTDPIPVPRTFEEWEYGMCGPTWYVDAEGVSGCCTEDCDQEIVFSGVKLIGDDACGVPPSSNPQVDPQLLVASGRSIDDRYGYRTSVKGDLMAVAAPNIAIPEYDRYSSPQATVDVSGAGAVFLYRRDADVAGKKAHWRFEDQLMLPTGFRSDYIEFTVENLLNFDQFTISGNKWQIGQNGREFGSSLDMCSSGTRETLAIGAPRAKWNRTFDDLRTSGIPCGALIVADLFSYDKKKIAGVAGAAKRFDILWKYFSAPWYGGTPEEFQPRIDMKVIVLQPCYETDDKSPVIHQQDWFVHKYISRLDDYDLSVDLGRELLGGVGDEEAFFTAGQPAIYNSMVSGMYEAFLEAFPSGGKDHNGENLVYSGIPAIMGMFKEKTGSTAGALQYIDNNKVTHNLYNDIKDLFNHYTFNSGVFDQTTGEPASGHLNIIEGKSENWYTDARSLIMDTFDSGRLSRTFTNTTLNRDFITSGVGQEWGDTHAFNVNEFQIPPHSGGRVYIFEKERNDFNCVQIITSPNDITSFVDVPGGDDSQSSGPTGSDHDELLFYGQEFNDRFGHSVGISTNGEVLTIGSPFSSSPCRIYLRDDEENTRLYNGVLGWLQKNLKTDNITHYDKILAESGKLSAQVSAYDSLSQTDRLSFRVDKEYWSNNLPTLYRFTYSYGYGDIKYVGINSFLSNFYAPSSRLGWSTAVSDDGDLVAFGAPTDSYNMFEDVNVYAENDDTWASYQYAGAVRMFQSRKYHPHSGVIEFGRFGNLDRSLHKAERDLGFYDQMGTFFGANADGTTTYKQKYFRRTPFSQIEIPSDAGLAFITTPELDAASDEIIDNIKNWLALGDRNLVLVGNDPLWEEDGAYAESNDVINKLLRKLGSRMRIHPAKNEEMSMQGCVSQQDKLNDKYNITTAFKPEKGTPRTVLTGNFYAKGVGDIRIDLSKDSKENFVEYMDCPEGLQQDIVNNKCEFPLKHNGDLRAQWQEECVKTVGNKKMKVRYKNNWPLQFQNFIPDCDNPPNTIINTPDLEPVPVLTTAEHLPSRYWVIPESSGRFSEWETIYASSIVETNTPFANFQPVNIDTVEFNIEEDSTSTPDGKFNNFDTGTFFDPPVKNGRDGLVQGVGSLVAGEPEYETITLYDESILAIAESGLNEAGNINNSKIYLIATDWSEDNPSRLGTPLHPTTNEDKNTEFYINLIQNSCEKAAKGIHLGGWTGNTSLSHAYYGKENPSTDLHKLSNKLKTELLGRGGQGYFRENQIFDGDENIDNQVDFVWIASPLEKPSDVDIARLRKWLDGGNKKLIITYSAANVDSRQSIASNVDYLCEKLSVSSRPFFVPNDGEYFVTDTIISSWYEKDEDGNSAGGAFEQFVNTESDSISGCKTGYGFSPAYNESTALSGLYFNPDSISNFQGSLGHGEISDRRKFIPISGGTNYEKIIWFDPDITTVISNNTSLWKMDLKGDMTFPTIPNSGYRMLFSWISETTLDTCSIFGALEGVRWEPRACDYFPLLDECKDKSEDDEPPAAPGNEDIEFSKTQPLMIASGQQLDFVATGSEIKLRLNTDQYKGKIPDKLIPNGVPHTVRLLTASGCPLPIDSGISSERYWKKRKVGQREINVRWEVFPATSGLIKGVSRPVMHKSHEYCRPGEEDCPGLGSTLIEDGPVVVAEEYETFSSFTDGQRRSKIIVITDSTMIQGQCNHYRQDAVTGNQAFIRSLYPPSPEASNAVAGGSNISFPLRGFADESEPEGIFDGGRNFFFSQKLRAPERGSVSKYHAVSGEHINNMTEPLYNGMGGVVGDLHNYTDAEDDIAPSVITGNGQRPDPIVLPEAKKQKIKNWGDSAKSKYGVFPRYSGDFLNYVGGGTDYSDWPGNPLGIAHDKDREFIIDAGVGGGLPELMLLNNTDYLDLDIYYSGCLGDLFGYSLDLIDNKLVVGTPFNGFYTEGATSGVSGIVQWHEIQNDPHFSGMRVAEDGGAGSVFYFEKTGSGKNAVSEKLPWEFVSKIKPSSLHVGIIDFSPSPSQALTRERGSHQLDDSSFITEYARRSDNFGYSVSIDSDMVVAGAPNHDFATLHHHIYSGTLVENDLNTAFQRKSFDGAFDIPLHSFYDLGDSGIRVDKFNDNSGTMILNNGAVFNYRHELLDFGNRKKQWILAEKLFSVGYNDRTSSEFIDVLGVPKLSVSGTENDRFGWSVSIDRAGRGDSDYTFVGGAPKHDWPTSGNHPTSGLESAGAAYTFDAMLRGQTPSIPNSGGWMDVDLFGGVNSDDNLSKLVEQNVTGGSQTHTVSGILVTNANGDAFIEVSGFDPSTKSFIAHRPYVESVKFVLTDGTNANGTLTLNIDGKPVEMSGDMPLSILAPDRANVYNSMNSYMFGVSGMSSGTYPLYLDVASGHDSGSLKLRIGSNIDTSNLDLRIRGF